jgi:hypothetical protein
MSFSNHGRFRQQVRFLRRQFLQDGELPFTDVLSERMITQALKALDVVWLDRIYSPRVNGSRKSERLAVEKFSARWVRGL